MTATGNCEYKMGDGTVCGKPTNESGRWGNRDFYFCHEHLKLGAEQVTGRKFKDSPKPIFGLNWSAGRLFGKTGSNGAIFLSTNITETPRRATTKLFRMVHRPRRSPIQLCPDAVALAARPCTRWLPEPSDYPQLTGSVYCSLRTY